MHVVKFTDEALEDLNNLTDDAVRCLNRNFISLIRNGYEPGDLPGRYKPSWHAAVITSPFHAVFIAKAEQLNLWHYHFGYASYKASLDATYPGCVSDAIAHTRRLESEGVETHEIIQVCLEHPSPFKIPWERITEST